MIVVVDNTAGQRVLMFFPKLLEFLDDRDVEYIVIKGDREGLKSLLAMDVKKINGVILSGSPIMIPDYTKTNKASNYQDNNILTNLRCIKTLSKLVPVLGICFGCQLMNAMYGGTLENVGGDRVLCKTMAIEQVGEMGNNKLPTKGKFCCKYMPDKVATCFTVKMTTQINGKEHPCFIKHKRRELWGCMFHPEALKSTHIVLDMFMSVCNM
jgi:anthranilate/para-aminobenzoate synthase component II